MIYLVESFANVLLGLALFSINLYIYRHMVGNPMRWIKLAYAIVGLYFAGIYSYLIIHPEHGVGIVGPVFTRPAITVTLAVMLAASILRYSTVSRGKRHE